MTDEELDALMKDVLLEGIGEGRLPHELARAAIAAMRKLR